MERTPIGALASKIDQEVMVRGFVDVVRDQKRMFFIIVRERTGAVQIAVDKEAMGAVFEAPSVGSAVTITGKCVAAPNVKLGGLEIQAKSFTINGLAETPLPIQPDSALDKKIDWRAVSLKNEKDFLLFEVQTAVEHLMREYWLKQDFIEIHSPKLMGVASESGAELFELEYFGGKAFLAQSPQFYKQMAMAAGFERVFEIGPVFRANPSFTSRHDTEFTSVDVEISWVNSHEDVMKFEEEWLTYVLAGIKAKYGDAIKQHFGVDVVVPTLPFPRVTMEEARELVAQTDYKIGRAADLDPEAERRLHAVIKEKTGHEFVFVKDWPKEVRAFYHMRDENDPNITLGFDLLWKGLEITTGAQREHRFDRLCKQAEEKGYTLGPLEDYLSFFRYGMPPHGGFGLGLTRVLMVLLGATNVREVTYLYRGPNRLRP